MKIENIFTVLLVRQKQVIARCQSCVVSLRIVVHRKMLTWSNESFTKTNSYNINPFIILSGTLMITSSLQMVIYQIFTRRANRASILYEQRVKNLKLLIKNNYWPRICDPLFQRDAICHITNDRMPISCDLRWRLYHHISLTYTV